MKIFVAGATGVLGRRVLPRLTQRGHQVSALTRSKGNSALIRELGAQPVSADLFDPASMRTACRGAAAVLHLATAIPTGTRTRLKDWEVNDRIRTDGTRALVDGALAAGVSLYLQQSVTFLYGDRNGAWVDESQSIDPDPGAILRSAAEMESIVDSARRSRRLPAVVLRFGWFHSHDAAHTRALIALALKRRLPILGAGDTYINFIHVDDAAECVARAVDRHDAIRGETFNVVDGAPVAQREFVTWLAERLGTPPPRRVPRWMLRFTLPKHQRETLSASHRCGNGRARERLGWTPAYAGYRESWSSILERG